MTAVSCDRCEAVYPGFCPRCRYLMDNMARWHRVALMEHERSCTQRGNCDGHVEQIYNELLNTERGNQ